MDKHDRSYLSKVSIKNPIHFISLGFGSGLIPKAPGTYGSLAALPICMLLVYLPWQVQIAVAVLTFFVGWYASSVTEKAMGMHDNSAIVIDEFDGVPQDTALALICIHQYRNLLETERQAVRLQFPDA